MALSGGTILGASLPSAKTKKGLQKRTSHRGLCPPLVSLIAGDAELPFGTNRMNGILTLSPYYLFEGQKIVPHTTHTPFSLFSGLPFDS
jgi:hypothetical protein